MSNSFVVAEYTKTSSKTIPSGIHLFKYTVSSKSKLVTTVLVIIWNIKVKNKVDHSLNRFATIIEETKVKDFQTHD